MLSWTNNQLKITWASSLLQKYIYYFWNVKLFLKWVYEFNWLFSQLLINLLDIFGVNFLVKVVRHRMETKMETQIDPKEEESNTEGNTKPGYVRFLLLKWFN